MSRRNGAVLSEPETPKPPPQEAPPGPALLEAVRGIVGVVGLAPEVRLVLLAMTLRGAPMRYTDIRTEAGLGDPDGVAAVGYARAAGLIRRVEGDIYTLEVQ